METSQTTNIKDLISIYLRREELENGKLPTTIKKYSKCLENFSNFLNIDDIKKLNVSHLKKFKVSIMKPNRTIKTNNMDLIPVRNFLDFCNEEGVTELNKHFLSIIRYRQTKKHLDLPDITNFKKLLTITDTNNPTETETFVNLAYYTGMRLSEMKALTIGEVKETFSVVGKGAKERLVICPPQVVALVRAYEHKRLQSPYKQPLLFPYTASSYQQKLTALGNEHNIKLHPHLLRHMFASTLVSNGADIFAVSSLLGHSSVSTTQIYAKISNKRLEDIHKSVFA